MRSIPLLLLTATVGTLAVPIDLSASRKCARECSGANNKFNYISGRSYEYRYETDTKVELPGPTGTNTFTGFDATVTITALSQCEHLIQISRVNFHGNKPDTQLGTALQLHPTRFSFDDGKIEHICPEANEPAWVTNVKRGVLSTLQHGFEGSDVEGHVFESDISGKCPTTYETRAEGSENQVVTKSKDLMSCAHHHKKVTGLRGVAYATEDQSEVRNMPLVNSRQTCRLTSKRQIMNEAVCTETHKLNPLKEGQAGVVATTNQKLQFVSDRQSDTSATEIIQSRKSLHFDDSDILRADVAEAQAKATDLLKKMCDTFAINGDEVVPETPKHFHMLIHYLRKLEKSDLQFMYTNTLSGGLCSKQKDIFLDAVPMIATEASVSVLADSIISGQYQHKWLTSLALIPKVTKQMVISVLPLIPVVKPEGYLGISSLISSYCHHHPNCNEDTDVQAAHTQFLQKVKKFCSGPSDKEGLMALKALGNIQRFPVDPILQNCGQSTGDRVVALMAMRRASCDSKTSILRNIFTSETEKTEIRLTAFMALMPCANQEIVTLVVDQLEREKNNQVASFVYSYLAEVRRSEDPEKAELKALILAARPKRVDKDSRKFSRFYETSQFWDSINLGAHAESGVIFSPESFTPRQAFLNLTVDLFGSSINFLELGTRMEGVDDVLAKMFGRHGYFSDTLNYLMKEKDREKKQHSNPKIKEMDDQISGASQAEAFDVSMYLRMFGDDLYHFSLQDANPMNTVEERTNIMSYMKEFVNKKEMKFSRNVMFLDSTLLIPTVSGLPLKLAMSGTASINVEAAAKLAMATRQSPNTEILGVLKPSAAVRVVTRMGIHTGRHVSGIVLVSKLYHSTSREVQITIKDNSKFNLRINVPKDKSEILDIQSELFSSQEGEWKEEKGVVENRVEGKLCSPESLGKVFGIKICTEISYPNASHIVGPPYFPFTGPSKLSVYYIKSDPTLTSYEVNAAFTPTKEKTTGRVTFNTPGSTVNREVSGQFELSNGFKKVKVDLTSPWKLSKFDGNFQTTYEKGGYELDGQITATVDNDRTYQIATNLRKKELPENQRIAYSWKADVTNAEKLTKSFNGRYEKSRSGSFLADVKMINFYESPIVLTVAHDVNRESQQVKIRSNSELQVPWYHLNGHVEMDYDKVCGADCDVKSKIVLKYRNPKIQPEPNTITLTTNGNWKTDSATGQKVGKLISSHELSKYPEKNGILKYQSTSTATLFQEKIEFVYGQDFTSEVNKLTVDVNSKKSAAGSWDRSTEVAVKFPPKQIDHKITAKYEGTPANQPFSAKLTFDVANPQGAKVVDGLVRLLGPTRSTENNLLKFEGEAKLRCSTRNIDLQLYKSVVEKSPMEYKSITIAQWQTDKKLEIESDVKVKNMNDQLSYEFEILSEARMTDYPPMKIQEKLKYSPTQLHYLSQSKHGEKVLHDLKFQMTNEGDQRRIQAHILTGTAKPMDLALDATYVTQTELRKTDFTLKKQGDVFAKGELILPVFTKKIYEMDEAIMSGNVHWDLAQEAKVVGFEYKNSREDRYRTHALTLRSKMSADADYKLRTQCSWQSKLHAMQNYTLTRNELETLKMNVGYKLSATDSIVDFMLKTQESMGDRHVSGLALFNGPNFFRDNFHSEGTVRNHLGGKKYSYSLDQRRSEDANGKQREWKTAITTPEGRMMSTMNYDKTVSGDDTSRHYGVKVIYGTPSEGTPQKTLAYDLTVKHNKNSMAFGFDSVLSTPFERLNNLQTAFDWSKVDNQHRHTIKLSWNDKTLGGTMVGSLGWHSTQMTVTMDTPYQRLKKVQVNLIHSNEVADAKLNWNEVNYIRVVRERRSVDRDSAEQKLGFELKVSDKADWNIRTSTVLSATKYEVSGNADFDGRTYAISGQFDKGATTAVIKLETPTIPSRQIEVNCPNGDSCSGKWMKNNQPSITVDLKWEKTGESGKFYSLTIRDIPNPFKVEYKYVHTEKHVNFHVLMVNDLSSPDTNSYRLTLDVLREPTSDSRTFTLGYPGRTVTAAISRNMQSSSNNGVKLALNLNQGAPGDHEMLFDYSFKGTHGKEYNIDAKLKCPMVERPLSLSYSFRNRGDLRFVDHFHETKFGYSSDQSKDLKVTVHTTKSPGGSNRNYVVTVERPASNLFVTIDHGCDDLAKALHLKLQFNNPQGQKLGYGFKWEAPTDKPSKLELSTGEDTWVAECQADRAKNERPTVVSKNGVQLYKLLLKIDPDNQLARAEITDLRTTRTIFHISGRVLERNGFSVKAYHTDDSQQKIDDLEVTIKGSEENILKSKFVLRPEIRSEVQNWLIRSTDTSRGVPQMPHRLRDFAAVLIETQRQIVDDLSTSCKPGLQGTVEELKNIQREMTPDQASLRGTFGEPYKYLSEMLHDVTSFWIITVNEFVAATSPDAWKQYYADMTAQLNTMSDNFLENYRSARQSTVEFFRSLSNGFYRVTDEMRQTKNRFVTFAENNWGIKELREYMDEAKKNIAESQFVANVKSWYESAKTSGPADYDFQSVKEYYSFTVDWIKDFTTEFCARTTEYYRTVYGRVMANEDLQPFVEFMNTVGEKMKWTYNYYNPRGRVKSLMDWGTEESKKLGLSTAADWKQYVPRVTVNDPATGRYEMETKMVPMVGMPDTQDLKKMFTSVADVPALKKIIESWKGKLSADMQDFQDWVDDMVVSQTSKKEDVVPPYDSFAMLVGDRHFITFDKTGYDFSGECSYLLTRDFKDGLFTVTVDYERQAGRLRRKSVSVHVEDEVVEILSNGKVIVNSQEVDLPDYSEDNERTISRKEGKISLKYDGLLKVKCDIANNICSIRVDGWHHADTKGMLGVNDNEWANDISLPDGSDSASQLDNFASRWSVSSSCSARNEADIEQNRVVPDDVKDRCQDYFVDKSSPLRGCFKQVPTDPYVTMCETELLASTQRPVSQGLCTVLAAYAYACKHEGIDISVPTECVSCSIGSKTVSDDDHVNLETIPRTADVVFIVDEKKCPGKEELTGKIYDLAQVIAEKLQQLESPISTRFGLVGFNGPNVHSKPHLHTGGGLVNFELSTLRTAAQRLQFRTPKAKDDLNISPMSAISFAVAHFPFRTGAKKVAVMVKCTSCEDSTEDYYDLQYEVLHSGMTLHILQEEPVEVTGGTDEYIGIDARSVYTIGDTEKIEPRKDLRKKVTQPHDACSVLAQESNGTVFHRAPITRAFSQVFAQRLSETTEPHSCQVCDCRNEGNQPKTVCHPCQPVRPSSALTSDSFFNIHYMKPLRDLQKKVVEVGQSIVEGTGV